MNAGDVAKALGGHGARGVENYEAPYPVPSHGQGRGDRNHSLSLRDGDKGLLVKCHAGCDPRDVLAEIKRRGLSNGSSSCSISSSSRSDQPDRDLAEYARKLWQEAREISGTLAERYLREHRCITIALPPSLRFHPRVKVPRASLWFPALIAAVSGKDRRILAVQVTWLDPATAGKANVTPHRRTFGAMNRGAVRLGRADDTLGLAEGVETALAARELTAIVTWATLGAARLDRVQIPDDVEWLHIFGDADPAGWATAEAAADRLGRRHQVRLHWPPEPHKDFNDALIARMEAGEA